MSRERRGGDLNQPPNTSSSFVDLFDGTELLMLRYMLQSPFGHWADDGSRFVYDIAKVAKATGYTVEEVQALGLHHCIRFPRTITAVNQQTGGAP